MYRAVQSPLPEIRLSRKGNCRDSAVPKRFFLNLRMARVWQRDYTNPVEAKIDIAAYIIGFYNCQRLHSIPATCPPSTNGTWQ